jgi:hypothetical protein
MTNNVDKMTPQELAKMERNIKLGYGEIVEYKWRDLEFVNDASEEEVDEDTPKVKKLHKKNKVEVVVDKVNRYYVGKMTLAVTSGVISILGAVFVNGANLQDATGRKDNIAFLEYLDEQHLGALFSIILQEDYQWVDENFDPTQVLRVMRTFFKYNDFLALLREVGEMGTGLGLSENKAREVALGKASLLG